MDEIGSLLKEERESAGISILEVSKDIDIKESVILNIEAGCIGSFKDVFILKDIIFNYSKYLGLNPEEMVDKFNVYLFEYTSKIPLKEIEKVVNEMQKTESLEEEKVLSPYTKEHEVSYKGHYLIVGIVIMLLVLLSIWWARNQVAIGDISTNMISYNR